jgi:ABC-type Fe3+ transport system substrate-binding protein
VKPGEITNAKDLLHPKWTGRIASSTGFSAFAAASISRSWGTDVVRRLVVDQRPAFGEGGRVLAEKLVLGGYPIALGLSPKGLRPFREQGLADAIAYLDLPDVDIVLSTAMLHFERAPHPAAARLFANWVLTQQGQEFLTSTYPTNSARTDVAPFDPDTVGAAGKTYYDPDREANYRHNADARKLLEGLRVRTT